MELLHLKCLLWDLDGTLCDTDRLHMKVFQEFLRPHGFNNVDHKFYSENISGKHNPELFGALLPHLSPAEIHAMGVEKEALFRDLVTQSGAEPVAGLVDVLQAAHSRAPRLPSICVTNAPRVNAEFMLDKLKLGHFFDALIIGDECDRGKPHPDPYLAGMRAAGVGPAECVVFEDSPSGIRAAVAAGVKAIVGVATTQAPETLRAAGATHVISDYTNLTFALLDSLCAGS
eukprot:TRINITY_DN24035_c0_g1_i1.p1 TRINITY_DN24035_c0_g1~~TRINITY_DN24035_c0_g1_i1.p1  ORF type:complete len:230 (-),score=93.03 TRINITY_DN24035_c0_g1_i1:340-1029(-)